MKLAVCGGKGGVGKSTVAVNLARELDAVVIDADLTAPDLPKGRGPDLGEVLADRASPMEAIETHGSLDVLPCGRSETGPRAADIRRFPAVVDSIHRQYGWVVIDCPAGLARDVGYQIHSADAAIVVTTPTRTALVNAFRTRKLIRTLETPIAAVVLNKVATESDNGLVEPVEAAFGAPTLTVPRRMALVDAQEASAPLRDYRPDCIAVDSFASLGEIVERSKQQRPLSRS